MLKRAGHDQPHNGRSQIAPPAFVIVAGMAFAETPIQFLSDERSGGSVDGARLEFDPPFMLTMGDAQFGSRGQGGDVKEGGHPAVMPAHAGERIDDLSRQ